MNPETLDREEDPSDTSWLCRDDSDRDRMLDMQRRMRPFRAHACAILTLAIIALGPWLGWSALLFALPATACFAAADALMTKVKRPEHLMFASWIATVLAVAGAISVMGPPRVATLSWLAIPVLTLSSRFSMRGVLVGVALTIALLCALAFGLDAHGVLSAPVLIVAPLAQILCVAILCTPLMRSDIEHRSDAIIDQLTGMLNRKALSTRASELVEQSRLRSEPVGIIVADLDHFKSVNDNHGMRWETRCSRMSPICCASSYARLTWPTGWAARSSSCCFRGWTLARLSNWPSGCARRFPATWWATACLSR
jgi:hypothetical protein